ncbi:hypothetical protein DTO164E3_7774 [Paecilomyces variotii]|nr:hypothetical protein DTO164E3_7774 [Paecilomyces variotii]KAJ9266108.1 hypothetical protein DTO195F2_1223 [Paecilomyces variotii]KAJ9321797.1 hypothetical protein DTO027B3_7187 [Paecilomyces variotii]KAJ9327361.1 hypothetical protein DTO027B5_9019 [Paecilomyces variotii]KAJ9369285.1 hypothetical protein DTO282E5_6082 [Paecilomyces variotii]
MAEVNAVKSIRALQGVRLAGTPPDSLWDLSIQHPEEESPKGVIASITPYSQADINENSTPSSYPLVLPALTHPHIHLDKAFVHGAPEYADLLPSTGSFQEALSYTSQAKARFTTPDLLRRGGWLISESVASGVTAMRAFVEVDNAVELTCLEAGIKLKKTWKESCYIQLVCFAQDPLFSDSHGDENRHLMETAIRKPEVEVIGTTPYVEATTADAKRNIEWAIDRAIELGKHLDFHLDYNLDAGKEALVWHVVSTLHAKGWTTKVPGKRVMLGHCTRLTLFSDEEWNRLASQIQEYGLPISFVGLPTSDTYMASPPAASDNPPQVKQRGTLHVPDMIRKYGLDAVVGVNNVGNAFTPWGAPDPLSLACLGVGIYQKGTQTDAELLYECVSIRARAAIGLGGPSSSLSLREGQDADLLIIYNVDETGLGTPRTRRTVAEVVWDPPGRISRDVAYAGRLVMKPFAAERVASSPGATVLLV